MKLLSFVPALEFINVFSLLYAVTGILWCFLSKGNQDYVPFSLFITLFFCRFFYCCRWLSCCMYEVCPHTGSSDRLAIFFSHQFHHVWKNCHFYLFLKLYTTLLYRVEYWFSWCCGETAFLALFKFTLWYKCGPHKLNVPVSVSWVKQCIFITNILRKCLSWYLAWHWWLRTAAFVSCFFLLVNYSSTNFKENMLCQLGTVQLTWKFIGTDLTLLTSKKHIINMT